MPVLPRATWFGVIEVIRGPALVWKQVRQVTRPPSVVRTVTSPGPTVAAPAIETVAVIRVALLTSTDRTVRPGFVNATVAPGRKSLPAMTMRWFVAPWPREDGVTEVMAGRLMLVPPI